DAAVTPQTWKGIRGELNPPPRRSQRRVRSATPQTPLMAPKGAVDPGGIEPPSLALQARALPIRHKSSQAEGAGVEPASPRGGKPAFRAGHANRYRAPFQKAKRRLVNEVPALRLLRSAILAPRFSSPGWTRTTAFPVSEGDPAAGRRDCQAPRPGVEP